MRVDRAPTGASDEHGVTLVELLITMSIMGVVMAMAGAGLISMSRASKTNTDRSLVNANLRLAMERVARDARAANPIDVQCTPAVTPCSPLPVITYDTQIAFSVFCNPGISSDCPASGLRAVVYRVANNVFEYSYDGSSFRPLLTPDPDASAVAKAQNAVVNTASEPVFTYIKADGSELKTKDDPATPGDDTQLPEKFRDCTRAVRIHLKVVTENGQSANPADLSTTVNLRNYNEVSNC